MAKQKPNGIVWTDETWNPVRGCSLVSDGCTNCYAMHVASRFNGPGLPYEGLTVKTSQGAKWTGKIKLVHEALSHPLRWTKPRRVFVNSMGDLFHQDVPDSFIDQVVVVMALAQLHTFQILTKRPERMRDYWRDFTWERALRNCVGADGVSTIYGRSLQALYFHFGIYSNSAFKRHDALPIPNVWLGVSVENQATANHRIPLLLDTPASIRWLSLEPLIDAVDLTQIPYDGAPENVLVASEQRSKVDWVVLGGESGKGKKIRSLHPAHARSVRDQCKAADTDFLFKQWGEYLPAEIVGHAAIHNGIPIGGNYEFADQTTEAHFGGQVPHNAPMQTLDPVTVAFRIGKSASGRLLDGVVHNDFPSASKADLPREDEPVA